MGSLSIEEISNEELKEIIELGRCSDPECLHLMAAHWMDTISEYHYCLIEACPCSFEYEEEND